MKKYLKRMIVGLLLVATAAGGVCLWQWDNITALKTSVSYSREDISQLMEENDRKVSDASTLVEGVTVRDLTEEEKAALRDETVDREAIIRQMIGESAATVTQPADGESAAESTVTDENQTPPQENPQQTPQETPSEAPQQTPEAKPEEKPGQNAKDPRREELSRLIAEIYLMKTEYTAWLDQMHTAAIEEFVALPEAEQTTASKYKIGMAYMKEGLAKEDECDAKMAEIQDRIRALLTELGESTALVDEIQAAYEEEKTLKKAYYLGLHD